MTAPWQPLHEWWFGADVQAAAHEIAAARSKLWFGKNVMQDNEARELFAPLVRDALAGQLNDWLTDPRGLLAVVLLLDQLPRMIYRNNPKSFAGDSQAQALVRDGIEAGLDQQLQPIERVFIYLVLEHAEDPGQQRRAVSQFRRLLDEAGPADQQVFADYLDYAERHQRVIERFNRFPHRNTVLGRRSSGEEVAFLKEPGSRF